MMGLMRSMVCQVRDSDQAQNDAHQRESLSVPLLQQVILPERDHEEAHENTLNVTLGKGNLDRLSVTVTPVRVTVILSQKGTFYTENQMTVARLSL